MAEKKTGNTDWESLDRLTDQEVEDRASSDPDHKPFTDEDFARIKPVANPKIFRPATAGEYVQLTDEEVARRKAERIKRKD